MRRHFGPSLIPATLLVVFLPCLTGTHFLSGFDFTGYWYPFMAHAQEWFRREGTLPFWIPQLFCGIPLGEALGPAVYYPTEILGWVLGIPPRHLYLGDTILHLLLAGVGAAALARSMGMSRSAGSVAGLAYMLGGVLMVQVRVGIPVSIRCAAIIPWMFLAAGHLRPPVADSGKPFRTMAVLSALMMLTGGYQLLAYTAIMLAIFLLFREGREKALAVAAAALALAATLSAVELLPNARYYLHSLRSTGGMDWGAVSPLNIADIPLFLFPSFHGPVDPQLVKYLGATALALALVGLFSKWRDRACWLAMLILAFLLSLGNQTPLGQAVSAIPLLGGFRVPMKWLLFAQLALALFAARGAFALENRGGKYGRILAIALPLLVAGDLTRWEIRLRQIGRVSPVSDGIIAELPRPANGDFFRIDSQEPAPVLNSRMATGLEWTSGYHTAPLAQYAFFYARAASTSVLPAVLPWMNTRYLVANSSSQAGDVYRPRRRMEGRDPVFGREARYNLCEAPDYAPRTWMAGRIVRASGTDETLALLSQNPPSSRLAVANTGDAIHLLTHPGMGTASLSRATPNAVEINASSRTAGLLVLADTFYPAWEAWVDGRRESVIRANCIFRAVRVPAGKHRVIFRWNSVVFNLGLWLSLLAWSVLAGLVFHKKDF